MIAIERQKQLIEIAESLQTQLDEKGHLSLHFICTHNSRRSQFAQAWSHALAQERHLPVSSFSGGVEITACNSRTVAALKRAGFEIEISVSNENPHYLIRWKSGTPLTLFSKLYDDVANPKSDFFALMTCSDADDNCPFIPGTIQRIPLRYKDPKYADDTPEESVAYDLCCHTIKTELQFIFDQLNP
jgi:arsenate reductase